LIIRFCLFCCQLLKVLGLAFGSLVLLLLLLPLSMQSLEATMQSLLTAVQHYIAGYEAFRDMVTTNRCVVVGAQQRKTKLTTPLFLTSVGWLAGLG
jgi:hypothetical protein